MVRNAVKSLTRYKMHLLHSLVALYIIIYAVTTCNLICSLFNNIILHSLLCLHFYLIILATIILFKHFSFLKRCVNLPDTQNHWFAWKGLSRNIKITSVYLNHCSKLCLARLDSCSKHFSQLHKFPSLHSNR